MSKTPGPEDPFTGFTVDNLASEEYLNDPKLASVAGNLVDFLIAAGIYSLQLPALIILAGDKKKYRAYSLMMGQEYYTAPSNWKRIKRAYKRWENIKEGFKAEGKSE